MDGFEKVYWILLFGVVVTFAVAVANLILYFGLGDVFTAIYGFDKGAMVLQINLGLLLFLFVAWLIVSIYRRTIHLKRKK
jgi:hypothetical protein